MVEDVSKQLHLFNKAILIVPNGTGLVVWDVLIDLILVKMIYVLLSVLSAELIHKIPDNVLLAIQDSSSILVNA